MPSNPMPKRLIICAVSVGGVATMCPAYAQPVTDSLIASAAVKTRDNCAVLQISFHSRVRYTGHFPLDHGSDLRINFAPIDPLGLEQLRAIGREATPVGDGAAAGVRAVTIDSAQATGSVLRIQFNRSTTYDVAQLSDDSVSVFLPRPGPSLPCKRDKSFGRGTDSQMAAQRVRPESARSSPKATKGGPSSANPKSIERSLEEVRAAIWRNRTDDAIGILEGVLRAPESELTADALELLGEARQKAGRIDEARKAFEDYLRRYPDGEGGARVSRRLAEIKDKKYLSPPSLDSGRSAREGHAGADGKGQSTWTTSGGISSFFIRDDSYNTTKDISIAPDPFADPDAHRFHQNMFLTNIDLFGSIDNDTAKTRFKLSGSDEHRILSNNADIDRYGFSTAYIESTIKQTDITARIGRQTRNTSGVIGRFDGALLSAPLTDRIRVNAVGGAPNWSRFDAPLRDGRYFAGASLDFVKPVDGLDLSIYALQQNSRGLLDRRAVGGEFRYFNNDKNALGMLDYDIHFNRINAGLFSGSWTLDDQSVLSGGVNYLRVPYLASFNALQGQPFLTLFDMLKFRTRDDVRHFAIDRTPVFESAMVGYSKPLNEHFQLNFDTTVTHVSGTFPSGGVDGTKPSGREYYFSSQLVGTDLFKGGDLYSIHLRHAQLADSNVYFIDLNARYPVNDEFTINPRLRAGIREGRNTPLKEFTVLPSVLVDYYIAKNLALEAEVGAKWIDGKDRTGVRSTTKSQFITLGLRSEFNADGAYRCAGALTPCLGMFSAPPSEPQPHEALYYGDGMGGADTAGSIPERSEPTQSPAYVVDGGVRYWYSRGRNAYDYFADGSGNTRVSRLSYSKLEAHTGEMHARLDARHGLLSNIFVKGYVGGGGVSGGRLTDEDFSPDTSALLGRTASKASGELRYASIDIGYNVYTSALLRLGAFAGFHTWLETIDAKGCAQTGVGSSCVDPAPGAFRVVSEKDRWNSFRVGAVVDVNLSKRLKWSIDIALTSTSQRALDTHYIGANLFPAKGKGGGFQAETSLKYLAADNLTLGLGFRWWRLNSFASDTYGQLLKYRTDRYGIFAEANYRLNFSDAPLAGDVNP